MRKTIIQSILTTSMLAALCLTGCQSKKSITMDLIPEANFSGTLNGKTVSLYTLKNKNGITAQVTNYGGRVVSLWVPDKDGKFDDIVLGYDHLDGYLHSHEKYYGATIGRYGNRIANGRFSLNGTVYALEKNNGPNTLHGGKVGFCDVVWDAKQLSDKVLELTYTSPDGEESFPGNLKVKVTYTLSDSDALKIEYYASTDKATPVNLTHHSFFNLHGSGKGTINDHVLQINADHYTPVDSTLIPTGEIAPVENTVMDFREPKSIGARVNNDFIQLKYGKGYDHNWVLYNTKETIQLAAKVSDPVSGRRMDVYTNEPGLQFYGGNFLDGRDTGKYHQPYEHRTAFCLETQHFPDSPNQPNFPSTILQPGHIYHSICIYKFDSK